ncbi:hypothetical protein ACVBEH_02155 [Roseateles sp. GG27B]
MNENTMALLLLGEKLLLAFPLGQIIFEATPSRRLFRQPFSTMLALDRLILNCFGAEGTIFHVMAEMCLVRNNVIAKRSTAAGRQARAGENVPRTTGPGLVACRWRSA